MIREVEVALYLTECQKHAALECEPRDVILASEVTYLGDPGCDEEIGKDHFGRCFTTGQVSL
jgi:hypothetical protein